MSFLDYEGLSRFYDKIKDLYSLKTSIPTMLPANGGNADTDLIQTRTVRPIGSPQLTP